jgi:zinc protease
MSLIRIAAAVLALAAAVGLAPSPVRAAPAPSHFTLANGLEVVVIPDHRTPVVTHMIWYKAGAADEPPGKSGIAHFLEHLMFKGTARNPAGKFSQIVADIGGQENAFTTMDYTAFYQRVSRENLAKVMALEADRMTGLVLTDAVVLPERDVILEERNQRIDNDPSALLGEQVQAALFLNSPYHKPTIGWRIEMEKLDRNDALAFYRHFYTPNNAILVVAGDVTAEEVKTLAQLTYGKIEPRSEIGPRIRPQEPKPLAARRVTLADPRVAQPSLQRSYLAPSETTAAKGESEALDVLVHVLARGSTSRLYQRLVVEKGVAASVNGWYQDTALDESHFALYATPRTGITLPQLESALDGELDDVIAHGVTADELARAKSRMVADMVYAQDSQTMLARIYGAALATGSSVEKVLNWTDRILAVTPEAVHAAAQRWLDKRASVTGYLVQQQPAGRKRS